MNNGQIEVKVFKAWLLFFIVAAIGGVVPSAVVGFVAGIVIALLGYAIADFTLYIKLVGFAIGTVVSFFCFKWAVTEYIVPQLIDKPAKESLATTPDRHPNLLANDQHGY